MINAPMAWPGCKVDYLSRLLKLIPKTGRFIDVFGGSGVVLINMPEQKYEVYNDINGDLVNFYRCLQDRMQLEELIHLLKISIYSRELFDEYMVDLKTKQLSNVERAYRWYYILRASFSGLGRHFGRSLTGNAETMRLYDRIPALEMIHFRIKKVYIENRDALLCIKENDRKDTVFYIDPPYVGTQVGTYKENFDRHKELLDLIFKSEGHFVVSGEPSDLYDQYNWDFTEEWSARGKVNNGDRKTRTECIFIKH